jgi:hypothetical protein
MSDLVTQLGMQANAFSNFNFWSGHEPIQEETAIITDPREAADRMADLELALVELSQINVANANVLASRVRWAARRALEHGTRRPDPTDDKINEAFKRATRVLTSCENLLLFSDSVWPRHPRPLLRQQQRI